MRCTTLGSAVAAALACTAVATAQQPAATSGLRYRIEYERLIGRPNTDYREELLVGGFRFTIPSLQLEIRGQNGLLLLDLETAQGLLEERDPKGPPHRGIGLPEPRRRLSPDELRARMERTLQAVGTATKLPEDGNADRALDLVRYLYFEGGITVVRGGEQVIHCDRLWISPLDDRIVVENAELRYTTAGTPPKTLVVRGPRLIKSGPRWTGRDLTITTCTAGEPHINLFSGEAEIRERPGEFEVTSRGQTLQVGGSDVLPLPDAHFFTGSQSEFPIKRVTAGYSGKQGFDAEVLVGSQWNGAGGALHQALTGRPASEFRGDWEVGVGWIEKRGEPLRGAVDYRAPGLYEGRTEAFWLDDHGENLREIVDRYDGSPVDATSRGMLRTQNRVHFGADTHLDVQAFHATDPAVLSEFFPGDYRNAEVPETSTYLHHAVGNHLITVGTRFNLDTFSYRDDRGLAERFVEEEPVVTWNWIAQPIATTPWETPIVLDVQTDVGERRSDYDDRAGTRVSDRTFRADQQVELSAPFHYANLNFRPYFAGRGTFYDHAIDGNDEGRVAMETGVQVGTRLSRAWHWAEDDGEHGLRHVIAPLVTFADRFRVDDQPGDFHQFDATDTLVEQNLVRVEVRNLVERMVPKDGRSGALEPRDVLMVDLAQDFWPEASRDHGGDELGLFYYDVLVRPQAQWLPGENFAFALYGDHDWRDGLRTLDTEVTFGPFAGIDWTAEYRTDAEVRGAVGVGADTRLFDRWDLVARTLYDLEQHDFVTYGFGLRRNDHDWSIAIVGSYDPFADETSLRVEFQPRFGGLGRGRDDRFAGSHLHETGLATMY